MSRTSLISWIAGFAIVLGATSWSQPGISTVDLWWHLASGRHIAATGEIPKVDIFSHTAAGEPWLNHGWLWGRLAWSAYRVHPDWLAGVNFALIAATFGLFAWVGRRETNSWLAAGIATWLAAATSSWFFDLRPQMVTLFFSGLLLASFHFRTWRGPILWPAIFLVWANLHAGYAFGLGLVGLHLLIETARGFAGRDRKAIPLSGWLGLGISVLAIGVNPWGFEIYAVPFQPLDPDTPFQGLIEWLPPALGFDPRHYGGRFVWMAIFAATGVVCLRRAPFPFALAGVTLLMALSARRFIPLFALCAVPVTALGLSVAWDAIRRRAPVLSRPRTRALGALVALAIAFALWQEVRLFPDWLRRSTASDLMPSGAVAYLESLPRPPRRLFHEYTWGGYLALQAPSVPVFIDGRAGTVYSDDLARDYLVIAGAREGWRAVLDRHRIDAALVPIHAPLAIALQRSPNPWRTLHSDPRSILLVAPDFEEPAQGPSEALSNDADRKLFEAYRARSAGEDEEAKAAYSEAIELNPLLLDAYSELMEIAALEGEPGVVETLTEVALRAMPRRRSQIWNSVEYAWQRVDDVQRQLGALHQIRLNGPSTPDWLLEATAERLREAQELAVERAR